MKLRSLFLSSACLLAMSMCLVSCDDEDGEEVPPPADEQTSTVYILNEGNLGQNDADIDEILFNHEDDTWSLMGNVFSTVNEVGLGDTGQDMIEYDGYLYVTVANSSVMYKLDKDCKKLAEVSFSAEEGQPRFMAAEDGKIYLTLYSGNVMRLDAGTLQKEGMVQVGMNPEGIVEEDGKLYVANGGWGYDRTMSVIDIASFTVEETVTVADNPDRILESEDKIFIQSYGGAYPDYTYPVEMYDPKTGNLSTIGHATKFAAYDGVIYMAYCETDWETYTTTTTFSSYNVKTGEHKDGAFVGGLDVLKNSSIYMMEINPETGDFYFGVSDYTSLGTVICISRAGETLGSWTSGSLNPKKAVFMD